MSVNVSSNSGKLSSEIVCADYPYDKWRMAQSLAKEGSSHRDANATVCERSVLSLIIKAKQLFL